MKLGWCGPEKGTATRYSVGVNPAGPRSGACSDAQTDARGQPRACEPRLRRFEVVLADSCLVAEVGEESPTEGALDRQDRHPLNEAAAEAVLVVVRRAGLTALFQRGARSARLDDHDRVRQR